MTKDDDPKAFINALERTAVAAGWPKAQWATVFIPCLIGLAQQSVDTLPLHDLGKYKKVRAAVLQTLNLNPQGVSEVVREIDFGLDYHP